MFLSSTAMKTEFEVKILDIDVDEIARKLDKLKAKKISDRMQMRYVYDIDPNNKSSWIRLRNDGKKTTLTIKSIEHDNIDGTKEIEVEVDDFDVTNKILEGIGFKAKAYQENRRISYGLGKAEVDIDFWPRIPAYLEVEGDSAEDVKEAVAKLGFKMSDTTSINTLYVYKKYGIDSSKIKRLIFE